MISRRILAAVAIACSFASPALAQKTKAQLTTEIGTTYPDNTVGSITPLGVRTYETDVINSIMPTAPVVAGNIACFNGTTGLLQDCGSAPTTVPLTVGTTPISGGTSGNIVYDNAGKLGETAFVPLVNGGLGASQSAATANQIPVFPGSGGGAVPTTVGGSGGFFDTICSSTIGQAWVRATGGWGCTALGWANPVWWGADPTGVADSTAAFTSALAASTNVFVPAGTFCLYSGISWSTQRVTLSGIGWFATTLDTCGHNVATVSVTGAQSIIKNLTINGYNATTAAHPALVLNSGAVETLVTHVLTQYGSIPLYVAAVDARVQFSKAIYAYGGADAYVIAGSHWLGDKIDHPWPVSTPSNHSLTINAWAATTGYTLGQVVSTGGFNIQCSQAGTSGGSAPTLQPYGTAITDGTAKWLLVGATGLYGMDIDTGGSSTDLMQVDLTGATFAGLALTNSASGVAPVQVLAQEVTVSGITYDIDLAAGADFQLTNSIINDCVGASCTGLVTASSWVSDLLVSNSLVVGNANGIFLSAGQNSTISNNTIVGNSGNGIVVAAGISQFIISGNLLGSSTKYGANGTAVAVTTGSSDYYNIVNNIVHGATTGVSDNGTGTHKTISGNN